MKRISAYLYALTIGLILPSITFAACPNDSVQSGNICIDKYESSVWKVNPTQVIAIQRIRNGNITLANLQTIGAIQLGLTETDLAENNCPATGKGCTNIYAISIPGVLPSRFMSYFQAIAAARNSWKRLPTNQEWQMSALGTPDGAPCLVSSFNITGTIGCVSDVGAYDMVGNLHEMVAEWIHQSESELPLCIPGSGGWGTFSDDQMCYSATRGLVRGGGVGGSGSGDAAGPFASDSIYLPNTSENSNIGFRAVR